MKPSHVEERPAAARVVGKGLRRGSRRTHLRPMFRNGSGRCGGRQRGGRGCRVGLRNGISQPAGQHDGQHGKHRECRSVGRSPQLSASAPSTGVRTLRR